MPDIGKAYVQIIPRADGMQSSLEGLLMGEAAAAGRTAGGAAGSGFVGSFGKAAALLGGVSAVKAGVDFFKDSMQLGMDFDAAMSQVAATMGTTVDQIGELRDAAREAGRTTRYTAQESAQALNYMALAGYDAGTSMQMLPTVLNLAAAGGMDLALASDMITDSQSALNLSLDDTTKLVDQMARASSKSNTSVAQLGEAILTVGGNAQFMAGGTTELATVLGILADNGIKGAEGGTHLRNMLLSLSDPTKDARDMMDKLGVSIFDADGNMRAFADFFPELQQALAGLTSEEQMQALGAIFNTRDMAAAQALLQTTTDRWYELGGAISDSAGAAQQMAETQTDNLQGDLMELKNKWDDLKISIAEGAEPAARSFVQNATGMLDGLLGFIDQYAPQLREAAQVDANAIAGPFFEMDGTALGEAISDVATAVASDGSRFLDAGLEATSGFGQGAVQGIEEQTSVIGDLWNGFLEALGFQVEEQTGPLSAKAQAMADGAGKPLSSLQNESGGWGTHMGANFAANLAAQAPAAAAAASAVAAAAARPLRHSVPVEGPLSDDDLWGGHMIQNIIGSMEREAPNLRSTADRMAGIVRDGMQFDNGVLRADVRGTGTQAGGGNEQVIAELRQLQQAIRGMGVYLDSGRLIGAVDGGIGRVRVSKERRSV